MEEKGPTAYVFAYGMIQAYYFIALVPSLPETWFWGCMIVGESSWWVFGCRVGLILTLKEMT